MIKDDIVVALRNADVSGYALSLFKRFVAGDTPTGADYTIFIQMARQHRWVAVVDSILEILQRNSLFGFRIEIIEYRAIQHFFLPVVVDLF